jgi:hypothetical protein
MCDKKNIVLDSSATLKTNLRHLLSHWNVQYHTISKAIDGYLQYVDDINWIMDLTECLKSFGTSADKVVKIFPQCYLDFAQDRISSMRKTSFFFYWKSRRGRV